ncbi:MAG: YdeI/OmpD-associated family protein [Anaerolineae bacterium]|jgi:uncharacterized protein YdeI (YjbR/CyaY-like superfamily)|nr:YdeI/OmpD-associated family protein [Anaerolineae bacterium]
MQKTNPQVDLYLIDGCGRCPLYQTPQCKVHTWPEVLAELRRILLETELTEELKWKMPCYTFEGKNVAMLSAFKGHCAVSFFKGVLLKDPHSVLTAAGPNSQSDRQINFTSAEDALAHEAIIKAYVTEAIELEKSGAKVDFKPTADFDVPEELVKAFEEDPAFKLAFEALTPGRQRGYLLYFSGAKQSATRASRIEKCMPQILEGIGLHDKYGK